ncbi:MAG TPA: ElyC/SanA/YdcF family protein [Planctomycetota bacterium]|jgi:hypothetical protein|nr:ElyC/SanA/YdcF family protein [Planctomycetota bacterium]
MQRPRLLRRREVWIPTVWGCLAGLAVCFAASVFFVRHVYAFLAPEEPVGARLLVVEGWISPEELDQAAAFFRDRGYERIVTTGAPLPSGFERIGFASFAEFARDRLLARGIASDRIVAVPVPASAQDRTYLSAVIVREWAQHAGIAVDALDVFSSGVHSRRSWLLYRMAFGSGVRVGVFASRPNTYDPAAWWRTSAGTKSVLSESLAWLWTKCCFHAGPAGSHEERWGVPGPGR